MAFTKTANFRLYYGLYYRALCIVSINPILKMKHIHILLKTQNVPTDKCIQQNVFTLYTVYSTSNFSNAFLSGWNNLFVVLWKTGNKNHLIYAYFQNHSLDH